MNVKKAIKKVVALGSGLTMIGATIMGATADLGDYPSPFVQNGVFSGKIVIGENANPIDVLGALDISAGLQAAAKTGVEVAGDTATTTISGGILLEDETNQDFNWGDGFSSAAIDETDFPDAMAEGILEDDDGTEYDYDQQVVVGNQTLAFDLVDSDVYDSPVLYLDLDLNNNYLLTYTLDFDTGDSADFTSLDDSESIDMFGTTWTIKNIDTGDNVVLYGSDVSTLVSLNNPIDVEVDGETYTLDIVGANGDTTPTEVHISVNGEVKAMSEGDTKTISGLKVFVQDVFVSTIGGQSASANLFIGSKELNLGDANNGWNQVQLDNEDLEGVEVNISGQDTAVDKIVFRIDANEITNVDTDEDYDWLALGDTFVDPLFGFEINFAEAVPSFMSDARDYMELKAVSDDLQITFTNNDGDEYTFKPYKQHTSNNASMMPGDDFVFSDSTLLADNAIFIIHEDASSSEPVSKVYQFTGLTGTTGSKKAKIKDLTGGSTQSYATGDAIGSSSYTVTVDETNDALNLSAPSVNYFYTEAGTKVTLQDIDGTHKNSLVLNFNEDEKAVKSDEIAGDDYNVTLTYDTTDDEFNIAAPANWAGASDAADDSGDYSYSVGSYGTYYKHDAQDSKTLEFWTPMEDVDYLVYLAGPDAVFTQTGGADDATYYNINPIGVGIGVLDTDAPSLGSTPMIVVGGPCANTVAAELMGNPANCAEGFEEGKAIIKYYDSNSAILVAGYSAMDTQGASRVLADYADYSLTGSEVEVVVPSLSSITVNPVQ